MEYSFEKSNIPNPPRGRNMPNHPRRREYAIFIDAERTHSPAAGVRHIPRDALCHIHCYRSSPYSLRRTMLRSYPITHLLPGIFEISQEAIAQQMNERIAMTGIAAQTGING